MPQNLRTTEHFDAILDLMLLSYNPSEPNAEEREQLNLIFTENPQNNPTNADVQGQE